MKIDDGYQQITNRSQILDLRFLRLGIKYPVSAEATADRQISNMNSLEVNYG